jgi:hypothetical protein
MLVLSGEVKIVMLGVVVGVSAAAALTGFTRSLLFEVRPADPSILVGVSTLFIIVALRALSQGDGRPLSTQCGHGELPRKSPGRTANNKSFWKPPTLDAAKSRVGWLPSRRF